MRQGIHNPVVELPAGRVAALPPAFVAPQRYLCIRRLGGPWVVLALAARPVGEERLAAPEQQTWRARGTTS